MSTMVLCIVIFVLTIILYATNKLEMGVVGLGGLALLVIFGCMEPNDALSYFAKDVYKRQPVDCLRAPENQCRRKDDCAALKLWEELDRAISGVVDHYTLEDLLKWQDEESEE